MKGDAEGDPVLWVQPHDQLGRPIDAAIVAAAQRNWKRVLSYAQRQGQDPTTAAEALDTVIQSLSSLVERHPRLLSRIKSLDYYIYCAAAHTLDRCAAKEPEVEYVGSSNDLSSLRGAHDSTWASRLEKELVLKEITSRMNERTRYLFNLRIMGCSWEDIARSLGTSADTVQVIFDASIEVRSAVVYATFAVVLVFVPILTMSGIAGRLFRPLGIAYILSVLASLVVALTVTPALSLIFLGKGRLSGDDPPLMRWLTARYRTVVLAVETVPRAVIAAVVVLTGLGLAAIPFFRASFLPELKEGHFIVHLSAVPGTSLLESLRTGRAVTGELLKIPYVRRVSQRVGRAEVSEDTWGTHYSEFEVDLKPHLNGEENEVALADIRKALAQFPGVNASVKTFLTERIEEIISGYTAGVVLNIYGPDLNVLDQKVGEVAKVVYTVPGAREVLIQSPPGTPQVAVQLRPGDLARWGFDPVSVLEAIHTAFGGETVGQVFQGNRVFDVVAILDPTERKNPADIAALPLKGPAGNYVPLGHLANVYETSGRYIILHDGARRVQTITLNVAGRDLSSFIDDTRRQILAKVQFPPDTYFDFTGTAAAQAQSRRDLLAHSLLAALGILALLSIVMMNYRNLLLVLANLPFALVGGVLAVFGSGGMLSLGSLIGFITLFGITLRNSIMMISHYEHLVSVEGVGWGLETAIRGASERLAPILMTATVTGLGLLPLAIGRGDPGREIEGPMAIVILGGLITSTVLNLLVLPTLALRYGRFEKIDQEAEST